MRTAVIILSLALPRLCLAQVVVSPLPPLPLVSGDDVVTLRDGTILRGHVTEMRPGDHVELVLLDGRTRIVQWADILGSVGPSFPRARVNPADRYLHPAPDRVAVVLESPRHSLTVGVLRAQPIIGQDALTIDQDGDVSQMTIDQQSRDGVVVCSATPCHIFARPGQLALQTSGTDRLSYSAEITVPRTGARVELRAPSASQRRWGALLAIMGPAPAVAGAVVMALGSIENASRPTNPLAPTMAANDNTGLYYGLGGALLGVGVAMEIAGIALWAHNRRGVDSVTPLADGITF